MPRRYDPSKHPIPSRHKDAKFTSYDRRFNEILQANESKLTRQQKRAMMREVRKIEKHVEKRS